VKHNKIPSNFSQRIYKMSKFTMKPNHEKERRSNLQNARKKWEGIMKPVDSKD
jgi:hypothetical protein